MARLLDLVTRRWFPFALFLLMALAFSADGGADVVLEKMMSREHPLFEAAGRRMSIGRDGFVYIVSNGGFLQRMTREGTNRIGVKVAFAAEIATANAEGIVAVAHAHQTSSVITLNPSLVPIGRVREFLSNDQVGWGSPNDVQVGASGDFYGLDQNRNRIVRIAAPSKVVSVYSLEQTGENFVSTNPRIRVNERLRRFYIGTSSNRIHALTFDGHLLWTIPAEIGGQSPPYDGEIDTDDEGNLYVLVRGADTIQVFGPDGKPRESIRLQMEGRQGIYISLAHWEDEIFVKRTHESELFQVYDRKTGKLKRVVPISMEVLKVEFPSAVWTAGETLPIKVTAALPDKVFQPSWPVQIALYNDSEWQDLPVVEGKITPPASAAGLYQVRVGCGEGRVETVVQIRKPNSQGTVTIMTPLNRVYYGRGEEIPVKLIVRGKGSPLAEKVSLRLEARSPGAPEVVQFKPSDITWAGNVGTVRITPELSAKLQPGRYLLNASVDDHTVAPQPLVIGTGLRERPIFNVIMGDDYSVGLTKGNTFEAPEEVATHAVRMQKMGINMLMERLADMRYVEFIAAPNVSSLVEQLKQDPLGVAPEKAELENVLKQTLAASGAVGVEEQAVLIHMDSTIPFDQGSETPILNQVQNFLTTTTSHLLPYPAFRGWSWASNWWLERDVSKVSNKKYSKQDWDRVRDGALATGKWNPEIERISDYWISIIPNLSKSLNDTLQKLAPGKHTALSGPYRQPAVIPSICFRDADEIDLYYQLEQIQPPCLPPHNVDFYRRDGKRTWGHTDTANDDGTGGMILANTLQMAMRGAQGTGYEGTTDIIWGTGKDNDPRTTGQGSISVHRALNAMLRQYGPWLTTLEGNDQIAIVVSTRMMRLDEWDCPIGSKYFLKLFEAYMACHFAHRPASYVFTEDVAAGKLNRFKAILVVGQSVELDPELTQALTAAEKAGAQVFYDDTCRKDCVSQFKPLNVAFNHVEKDNLWQDEAAYYRFPAYFKQDANGLKKVIGAVVPPVADVDNPEIMLTERRNGEGRFVWVLNNDYADWEPGVLWRVTTYMANRVPQIVPIQLHAEGQTVYELFAMKQVRGEAEADLRTLPARLFAVLPRPIESLKLTTSPRVTAGEKLTWSVEINGPKISYPLHLRLTDESGNLVEELFPTATSGALTVPLNVGPGVTLEAIELISGKRQQRKVEVVSSVGYASAAPVESSLPSLPVENLFGPHLREIAVNADGSQALINAMNWNENYYVVDTDGGKVRAQGSVGHHHAYAPLANGNRFFVQGYDVCTAEGYHLYELNGTGQPERRFATYGMPHRGTKWFGGPKLPTPINNFLISPDGKWIANAGNLGLVVWSKEGKKAWSQDWWSAKRQIMRLLMQGKETLVTLSEMKVAAYKIATGEKLWEIELAKTGTLQGGAASSDGQTLAVFSDTEKGRIFVIRDGKLINTFYVFPESVAIAPDGRHLGAIVHRKSQPGVLQTVGGFDLNWYATDGGAEWVFQGDEFLHSPQLSADGKKIAVSSDLGTLTVLNERGQKMLERDFGSLPTAAWLPNGELLVATWMGQVARLSAEGVEKWNVHLAPTQEARLKSTPQAETLLTLAPTSGSSLAKAAPLKPNLLDETGTAIRITDSRNGSSNYTLLNPPEILTDGQTQAPPKPWLEWSVISMSDSGWTGGTAIEVENLQSQWKLNGVTFVEDSEHPESWLRDIQIQIWDPAKEAWLDGPYLVSSKQTHTHLFSPPLEGAKFRFIGTGGPNWDANIGGVGWPEGNVRLAEMVFHGEVLGSSHPDVMADRPLAILFDENPSELHNLEGVKLLNDGPFSGERYATVGPGISGPRSIPPLGAVLPGWNFEIVEKPTKPGEYRWLQFAWKSMSKDTRGMSILIGSKWATDVYGIEAGSLDYGGLPDGRYAANGLQASKKITSSVPDQWQVVRIDLWKAFAKPTRLHTLGFVTTGGPAAFDQIVLGKTEGDLPPTSH